MSIFDLFNVRLAAGAAGPRAGAAAPTPGGGPTPPREGVFITRQSLASFAGASIVVTLLSQIAIVLVPAWKGSTWVPFLVALVVGAVVFMINEFDPEKLPRNLRDWVISAFIGLVNALVLFHAALGAGTYLAAG
jgi:hypothetical protein